MSFRYDKLKEVEKKRKDLLQNRNSSVKENFPFSREQSVSPSLMKKSKIFVIILTVVLILATGWLVLRLIANLKENRPIKNELKQANSLKPEKVLEKQYLEAVKYPEVVVEEMENGEVSIRFTGVKLDKWSKIDDYSVVLELGTASRLTVPKPLGRILLELEGIEDKVRKIVIRDREKRVFKSGVERANGDLIFSFFPEKIIHKVAIPLTKEELRLLDEQKIDDLLAQGKEEEAIKVLYQFVAEYPKVELQRERLISLLLKEGDLIKANRFIMEGLKLFPKALTLKKLQVQLKLIEHDFHAALGYLAKILEDYPHDLDCLALLASVSYQEKHYVKAVEVYRLLTNLDANNISWWFGLGLSLEAMGNWVEAKQVYQRLDVENLDEELRMFVKSRLEN